MSVRAPLEGDEPYDVTWRRFSLPRSAKNVSFRQYQSGTWCVIEAAGEIDIQVAPVMREVVDQAASEQVIFDLVKVTFIDSSGLAVLAEAWRRAKAAGGLVRLVAPCERVRRVLRITQFDKVMTIYETLEEATR